MEAPDALKILTPSKQILVKDMRETLDQSSLALKPKPGEQYSGQVRFTKEMTDFLYHNGNITRELSLDEIVKATSPEYMNIWRPISRRDHRRSEVCKRRGMSFFVIASEEHWIASSLTLLAMTALVDARTNSSCSARAKARKHVFAPGVPTVHVLANV